MERKFLESLKVGEESLSKEVVDSIMAEHGKTFKEKDEKLATLTTEKEGLSAQLVELNTKVKELSGIDAEKLKDEIKTLNDKYENDTKDLQTKLSKQNYDFKVKELTTGLKFSSESAKKAFIADLTAKELKLEEDKILGFDDFVKSYQESDPNAFTKEEDKKSDDGFRANTGDDHGKAPSNTIVSLKDAVKEKYDN